MLTAIFDGNYLLHRQMRVESLADLHNRNGKPTGGLFGTVKSIHQFLMMKHIQRCYIVFDSGISSRRRSILPQYKGDRHREPSDPLYVPQAPEDVEYRTRFYQQRRFLKFVLPHLGVRVVHFGSYEADDLIAWLVWRCGLSGIVFVVSDDKDLLQLVHDDTDHESATGFTGCYVYRPMAEQLVTARNFKDVIGYPDTELLLRHCILGDPGSDHIPGIEQVGKDTVKSLFNAQPPIVPYPWGDFFIWCSESASRRVRRIGDSMDIVLRNFDLISLRMEDHTPALPTLKKIVYAPVIHDPATVKRFFTEMDLFSIVRQFESWVIPFSRLS